MLKYIYSALRFVPDLASGEFVNIGVIVGSDSSSEWAYRLTRSLARMNTLAQVYQMDPSLTMLFVQRLTAILDKPSRDLPSEQWLARLSKNSLHMLRVTEPSVLLAPDLESALTKVFGVFVPAREIVGGNSLVYSSGMDDQINLDESYRENKARVVAEFERKFLTELLKATQGNITAAARRVQMDRKHLSDLVQKHGLRSVAHDTTQP